VLSEDFDPTQCRIGAGDAGDAAASAHPLGNFLGKIWANLEKFGQTLQIWTKLRQKRLRFGQI